MKIFATGATGYLGFHFVNEAIGLGHQVLCLRRKSSKSMFDSVVENKIEWIDIEDSKLKEKVCLFQPDVLFHAAWGGVRGRGRDDQNIQNENLIMSRQMFELYPYKQIVAIGSQSEYGFYHGPVDEDHALCPSMEYAYAKKQCCDDLKKYCESKDIEWQWIRIFTVFGEQQTGGLIKLAIDRCKGGDKGFDTTEGNQRYSYLYAVDFAKALCQVLGTKGKSGIYNLSQPVEVHSNRYILERIKEKMHSDIQLNFGAIPYADGQIMLMDGTVDKFVSAFGTIPHTDFELALNKTIESFK
mgnify:CR=1 FL=1